VKKMESGPSETIMEMPLCMGTTLGLSTELHDWELVPCEEFRQGLGESVNFSITQ
jgi:hypothetical protein